MHLLGATVCISKASRQVAVGYLHVDGLKRQAAIWLLLFSTKSCTRRLDAAVQPAHSDVLDISLSV